MNAPNQAAHATLSIPALRRFYARPETRAMIAEFKALVAEAVATRAKVDAYIAPVFARFSFVDQRTGEKITRDRDLYLADLDAPEVAEYYAACDAAHKANGYDLPAGYCPALVAEEKVRKAENAFLKAADAALGTPFARCYGKDRERALELLLNPPA